MFVRNGCSAIGEALAETITVFSLDIVGVVANYVVFGVATAGATPSHLFTFGADGDGDGQVNCGCYSLAYGSDDTVLVGDARGCQMFSSEGKILRHIGQREFSSQCFGIAVNNNGEIFLADTFGHHVLVCRVDGSFVRSFGSKGIGNGRSSKGSGNGQFDLPKGLAVDASGLLLFIVDCGNHRVQVLHRDGSFVRAFGTRGTGDGQLDCPFGVAVSAAAEVFVADRFNHRVQVIGLFLLRVRRCVAGVRR